MKRLLLQLALSLTVLSTTVLAAENQSAAQTARIPNAVAPTFQDVKYGAHEKELMNFWQFGAEKPVGVLLQIHGGGWMGGKKDETLRPHQITQGYHIASISYPLVNEGAVQPAMLNAALRAVQFLRYKADQWNIDPQRIVVAGGSAGGCSSLLVALHDNVADPKSSDPVKRFSSRVAGALVAGAQTTMNPFVIKERIGEETFGNPMPYKPFGAESAQELMDNWDQYKELVLKCSPITHLSKDDPPLHLFYNVNREFPATNSPNGIHSPIFGEIMLEACNKIGVECHLQYWEDDKPKPAVSRQEFLNRLLLGTALESKNTQSGEAVAKQGFVPTGAETFSRGLDNSFGIIPMPLSIEAKNGESFEIRAETTIVCQGEETKACAEYLQSRIANSSGLKLALENSGASIAIILKIVPEAIEFAEKDAYTFESSKDKIIITGKSTSGLFYGIQTLFQLLPAGIYSDTPVKDMKLSIVPLLIKDKPSMSNIRGLHVDIARHFRTKEELFKIIDSMAMHKLNTLHIHLTDDQGWRIEIKAFPKLTSVGAIGNKSNPEAPAKFLTQEDVREICAYAKSRYISIIPEVDMPGHIGSLIKAYPEMKHPKDLRTPAKVIRGDLKGINFVKTVLAEVNAMFNPEYIHIGCDEVNFRSKIEIYSEKELVAFAKAVSTFIKDDLKKTPIVWDDAFMHGYHDKNTVVHWWRYGKEYWWRNLERPVDEELNLRKQPFIISPAYWTYFDMPNVKPKEGYQGWAKPISTAEVYNWDPFGDLLGVTEDTRDLAIGAIACTWSESIKTMKDFGDRTYPRLAAYSERIWRGGKEEAPSILSWPDYRDQVLIPFQLNRYDALGVHYWSKDKPELLLNLPDNHKKLTIKPPQTN